MSSISSSRVTKSPLPLRHLGAPAALDQMNELDQRRLEAVRVGAEGLDRRPHPRHVAVVVGAQRVHQAVRTPLELVAVVGDVGAEVGGLAAGTDQHPVLVVAERRGPQPDRPLALVDVAARAERLDRPLELPARVQRALREPAVEANAEAIQRRLDPLAHRLDPTVGEVVEIAGVGTGRGQLLGELGDVFALVALVGRLPSPHASGDGLGEAAHLAAGVVQVVLPLDPVAGEGEESSQRVTITGVTALGRGQRPGRVGGDELHQHPLGSLGGSAAEGIAGVEQGGEALAVPAIGQEDVDEPGAGDLDPVDASPQHAVELLAQSLGDLSRLLPARRGEQHRGVGGVVAQLRIRRSLEGGRDRRGRTVAQRVRGGADRDP